MKSNIFKKLSLLILLILCCFFIVGCDDNNEADVLKEKLNKEMDYLDSELLSMLNKLNNITLSTYKTTTEQIDTSNSSSSGGESSGQSKEGSSSGQSQGGGSSDSNKNGAEGQLQNSNNKQSTTITKMSSNSILLNTNYNPDWPYLKENIESIYTSWGTIIIDLYKAGVNNNDILSFSSTLEQSLISIKNEDKITSLNNLAKLYSYISTYLYSYSTDEILKNNQQTKSKIISAYSLVEQDDWNGISNNLADAEKYFMIIINNTNISSQSQSIVNKTYTLLKELQNSLTLQDKEVFYIKYKSLIEEISNII